MSSLNTEDSKYIIDKVIKSKKEIHKEIEEVNAFIKIPLIKLRYKDIELSNDTYEKINNHSENMSIAFVIDMKGERAFFELIANSCTQSFQDTETPKIINTDYLYLIIDKQIFLNIYSEKQLSLSKLFSIKIINDHTCLFKTKCDLLVEYYTSNQDIRGKAAKTLLDNASITGRADNGISEAIKFLIKKCPNDLIATFNKETNTVKCYKEMKLDKIMTRTYPTSHICVLTLAGIPEETLAGLKALDECINPNSHSLYGICVTKAVKELVNSIEENLSETLEVNNYDSDYITSQFIQIDNWLMEFMKIDNDLGLALPMLLNEEEFEEHTFKLPEINQFIEGDELWIRPDDKKKKSIFLNIGKYEKGSFKGIVVRLLGPYNAKWKTSAALKGPILETFKKDLLLNEYLYLITTKMDSLGAVSGRSVKDDVYIGIKLGDHLYQIGV